MRKGRLQHRQKSFSGQERKNNARKEKGNVRKCRVFHGYSIDGAVVLFRLKRCFKALGSKQWQVCEQALRLTSGNVLPLRVGGYKRIFIVFTSTRRTHRWHGKARIRMNYEHTSVIVFFFGCFLLPFCHLALLVTRSTWYVTPSQRIELQWEHHMKWVMFEERTAAKLVSKERKYVFVYPNANFQFPTLVQ